MNVVSKIKLPDLKKKKTRVIIALVLVAAVCTTWFAVKKFGGEKTDYSITEYTVNRGDIEVSITGSGSVQPIEQYDITALVNGDILNDYFNEGQEVKKGDLLYSIDTGDLENSIQKAQNSLSKAQLSYEQNLEDVENLTVESPISGVITSMSIETGDSLSKGAAVATILNTENLKATLPFNASDAKRISKGDKATVIVGSTGEQLSGTVSNVSSGQYIKDTGALVSDVEIRFQNPGALQSGEVVSAIVGDYACNAEGTAAYQDKVSLNAKTTGEVTAIYLKQGDKVEKGETILVMENESTQVNANSAALSVHDAELSLQDTYDKLDDYNITSPIDGKIIEKNSKAGDTLDSSNKSTVMAVVADMSKLTFTINVDELDISKIKAGQEVTVTADALSGSTFDGTVDNISIIGTSSNGVTTYPVDIVIENYGSLLPGMNVNASIIVDKAENVLMVPVSAVQRGNFVLMKKEAAAQKTGSENTSKDTSESGRTETEADAFQPGAGRPASAGAGGTRSQNGASDGGGTGAAAGTGGSTPSGANGDGTPSGTAGKTVSDETGKTSGTNGSANQRAEVANRMQERLNETAPEGYTYVPVTIGLNNEEYIEITSGLSEGDTIAILTTKTESSASQSQTRTNTSFGGGMGGPPQGGGGGVVVRTTGTTGTRSESRIGG